MSTSWRGHPTNLVDNEENKTTSCQLPDGNVVLHKDLARHVKEGDEIIVVGEVIDNSLHAIALNNLTVGKVVHVDVSNYMLTIGLAGFILIFGLIVIGRTSQGIGEGDPTLFGLMSLGGVALGIWAFLKSQVITKASRQISLL